MEIKVDSHQWNHTQGFRDEKGVSNYLIQTMVKLRNPVSDSSHLIVQTLGTILRWEPAFKSLWVEKSCMV